MNVLIVIVSYSMNAYSKCIIWSARHLADFERERGFWVETEVYRKDIVNRRKLLEF